MFWAYFGKKLAEGATGKKSGIGKSIIIGSCLMYLFLGALIFFAIISITTNNSFLSP
jgi:hypothetical protein